MSATARYAQKNRQSKSSASAQPVTTNFTEANWDINDTAYDWRVKLSLPESGEWANTSGLLQPLEETGGMVFPYTPTVYIVHSASYDKLSPTHSNYPFPIYQNSSIDSFVITGEFTAENKEEATYWVAVNHYLRSITKMSYGVESTGNPPPVVKLNGYGDFVFKNVPVVVEQYTVNLFPDVDYVQTSIGENGSWAPSRSEISVTLMPTYSRSSVNQFSLKKFVEGGYVLDPNAKGFI